MNISFLGFKKTGSDDGYEKMKKKCKFIKDAISLQFYDSAYAFLKEMFISTENPEQLLKKLNNFFTTIEDLKTEKINKIFKISFCADLAMKLIESQKREISEELTQIVINKLNSAYQQLQIKLQDMSSASPSLLSVVKTNLKKQFQLKNKEGDKKSVINKVKSSKILGYKQTKEIMHIQRQSKINQAQIISKTVSAYICYLLKARCYSQQEQIPNLTKEQNIWKQLNKLQKIMRIFQQIPVILRYFEIEYLNWILLILINVSKIVKDSYNEVSQYVLLIRAKIMKRIKQYNSWEEIPANLQESLAEEFQTTQLREVLIEMDRINQQMKIVFDNRKIYATIRKMNLERPLYVDIEHFCFEVIFNSPKRKQRKGFLGKSIVTTYCDQSCDTSLQFHMEMKIPEFHTQV